MTATPARRRALAPNQWEKRQKSLAPPSASSESPPPAEAGVMVVERRKVLGIIEQSPDGGVYIASYEPADVLQNPEPEAGTEVVEKAAEGDEVVEEVVWRCPIIDVAKATDDKDKQEDRLITGIVLKPEETDAHKDIYSAEVIRGAAHGFLRNYNASTGIGYMHRGVRSSLQLVESWIAPVDLTIGGRKIKKGTWLMTVYVPDDAVWEEVKAGKITGFSIGGTAKVRKLQAA